ncbi:MAG: hypothetical protein JEZ11_10090 [Desulfobacterales bacterium]|nr:hypothetical protein [Desulfobacterales bacterium]
MSWHLGDTIPGVRFKCAILYTGAEPPEGHEELNAMAPMDQRTIEEGVRVFDAEFFLGTGQTECFPSTNSFRGSEKRHDQDRR